MRVVRVGALAPIVFAAGCSLVLSFDDHAAGGDGGGGGDALAGDGAAGVDACTAGAVTSSPVDPTLVIALDASGSMGTQLGSSAASRLAEVVGALRDRMAARYAHVRVGVETFTGAGLAPCPTTMVVAPATGTASSLDAVYAATSPNGQAPLAEAIAGAGALATTPPAPGLVQILLLTDSPPVDCTAVTNLGAAVEAAARVAAAGARLDVIAIGPDLTDVEASAIASAGDGNAARVLEPDVLAGTIEASLARLDVCVFRPDDGGSADATAIFLDGAMVPSTDWAVEDGAVVRLTGASCTSYRAGPRRPVQVIRRCGG